MSSASGSGSDSESDIEIRTSLPLPQKFITKTPPSPQEHLTKEVKKMTVKSMVFATLQELNTRKGVSLYAIKRNMVEKYNADTEKLNFYIKKCIKTGVEAGDVVQTKGIGASGSFRLAPVKKTVKKVKNKKIANPEKPTKEKAEKKKKTEKVKSTEKKSDKKVEKKKITKEKSKKEIVMMDKEEKKPIKKTTKELKTEMITKESKKESKLKPKAAEAQTPSKKKVLMVKRKSIGSIIKKPKMKPKKRE